MLHRLTVATDSDSILAYCVEHGIPAARTSAEHTSGTNRLVEVMDQDGLAGSAAGIYVNIQGDEPMVTAHHIELLLRPFFDSRDSSPVQVSTLKVAISYEAAADSNAVKVVTDAQGRALYFSRAAIPYVRDGARRMPCYKHLGFYAYTAEALRRFRSLPPSPLEQAERLEQLRFLENAIPIAVVETTEDTTGVDTEEDLQRVEEYFRSAGIAPSRQHRGPA